MYLYGEPKCYRASGVSVRARDSSASIVRTTLSIEQDILIREPDQAETLRGEPVRADFVSSRSDFVRWAVDLDDEANRQADEIDDMATEPVLPAKATTTDSLSTELLPEALLRKRLVIS